MRRFSAFLLTALLLTMLVLPVAASAATAPTMPKVDVSQSTTQNLPENLGSIIGIALAGLMVLAVIVIVIIYKRKK